MTADPRTARLLWWGVIAAALALALKFAAAFWAIHQGARGPGP